MIGRFPPLALIIIAAGPTFPGLLHAHGALIEYSFAPGVLIQAKYDTGQPMSGAMVTVYAPDNPAKPWLTGTCDEAGRFSFVPDPSLAGMWSVQARLAGHGAMVHLNLEPGEPLLEQPVTSGFSGLQRFLMAAAVVWGCIGTALYFRRSRNPGAHS